MGKTKRVLYKQELRRAINNLGWCLLHLMRVIEAYQEAHPEIAEGLTALAVAIQDIAEMLESFEEKV